MASRYSRVKVETTSQGTNYLAPVMYPVVERGEDDIYVTAAEGDRYDRLSLEFYGDSQYWWVILAANSDTVRPDSLAIPPGVQIRIPENPENYIRQYQDFNNQSR